MARPLTKSETNRLMDYFTLAVVIQPVISFVLVDYEQTPYPYLGLLSTLSYAYCLNRFFTDRSFKHLIGCVLLVGVLILIKAKIAMFITVILTLTILYQFRKRKILIATLSVLAVAGVAVLLLPRVKNYVASIFKIKSFSWECALQAYKESSNYLIGTGVGNSEYALTEVYHRYPDWMAYMNYNAHNQYIETLLAQGLIGLAILLFWYFSIARTSVRSKNPMLGYLIIAVFLASFTESIFWREKGILFAVFFLTIFLSNDAVESTSSKVSLADEKKT